MKKQDTWESHVRPVRNFIRGNYGATKELAERMQKRTGIVKNWRVQIDWWSTDNPDRVVQPLYSIGKIFLEEAKAMMEEAEKAGKK